MKKLTKLIIALLCILCLQNCKDDDFNSANTVDPETEAEALKDQQFRSENFGNATTGNFIGTITNASGSKLENVRITIGNITTLTDRNGIFILNNANVFENFAYIKAQKEGYINGSRVVVPKTNGTNKISIVLLKNEFTDIVSSGIPSEVSLPNGSKVTFSGDFINADGTTYNGPVDVVLHYLRPNSETTFTQMPGSLFAQTESNDARSLETYGMFSVSLFSYYGDPLNINPDNPSTIEFPIDFSQSSIAPETINLWHFDEDEGYWKEDGQAVKDGDKYVAEVTHFTWWNCDIPFDAVEFCFSLSPATVNAPTTYRAVIQRSSNSQLIFSGAVTATEIECGLIPRNEEVTIAIYGLSGSCNNQLVHTETLGGYATDTTVDISFTEEASTTSITGMATNCDGNPITNGYIYINDANTVSITDGTINMGVQHCTTETVTVQIFDLDTYQWAIENSVILNGENINLGTLSTCSNSGGIYNGNITLLSQDEVNNFGIFNYSSINGNLQIGDYQEASDITDLTLLSALGNINGNLSINNNPNLQSLDGLSNITSVTSLSIRSNESLLSITSLSNLSSTGAITVTSNNALTSLNGLEGITDAGNIFISRNNSLTSLNGLQSINTAFRVNISNNESLSSIAQLSNLTTANSLQIYSSPSLTSLEGLNQITTLSLLRISYNDALTDLSELSNLTTAEVLSIGGNDSLTSLNGLENLISSDWILIGRDLEFDVINNAPNNSLENFCALQNLFTNGTYVDPPTSIFNGVYIQNNPFNPSVQDIINGNCSQ